LRRPVAFRHDLAACLLLAVLCLGFFWPVLLGHVLLPAERLFFADPLFVQHRPPDVSEWQNPILMPDLVGQMYPWRHFASQAVRSGQIPLWNPYSACGMPFLANDQSAVLNPTNLLLNSVLSPPRAQTAFVLLCLLGSCLFTYGLVRSLGAVPVAAVLSGMTFGFSGFIFVWLGLPLAATAMWLPALLWATHRLALRPTASGTALIAGIIGWQFLSGHLSTSVQMLAFWAIFASYEIISSRRSQLAARTRRLTAMLALALILGCGLGASQLLPLREYFGLSTIADGGRSRWSADSTAESLRHGLLGNGWFLRSVARGEIALLFNPEAHGNPAFQDYRKHPQYGNYAERSSYPGALALLVLLAGLVRPPPPGHRRFFLIAAWVILGILLHLPILNLATYLPVLRLTAPERMRFVFSLCAAVSLGLAASAWLRRPERNSRPIPAALWLAAALLVIPATSLAIQGLSHLHPRLAELSKGDVVLRFAKLFAPAAAAAVLSLLLFLAARRRVSATSLAAALLLVTLFDLLLFGARWHALSRPRNVLPLLPEIRRMRELAGSSRITGQSVVFRPNLSVAYHAYDTRVYDPISVGRYVALMEALAGEEPGAAPAISLGTAAPNPTFARLTSAEYRWETDASGVPILRRLSSALPRAYVTTAAHACDARSALGRIASGVDPWAITLIEGSFPSGPGERPVIPARLKTYGPHRISIEAEASDPAWLVLTDVYYPGWRADINGREVAIRPANYAFRAVPIPAGASTVTFSYEPSSYRLGLFIALLSLAILTSISVASWLPLPFRRGAGPSRVLR